MICRLSLVALLLLAACGTPLEQCERAAAADLRALETERAERARNLARGYALEPRLFPMAGPRICRDAETGAPVPCLSLADRWEPVPVPIRGRLEARRIELLDQLIVEERARAASAQAACRRQFPAE